MGSAETKNADSLPRLKKLWAQLRLKVWAQLRLNLRTQLRLNLRTQLRLKLLAQLRLKLLAQLRLKLLAQLRSPGTVCSSPTAKFEEETLQDKWFLWFFPKQHRRQLV